MKRREFLLTPAVLIAVPRLSALAVSRPAPATTFRGPDGSVIDPAKYRGRIVAMEFLNTECSHCQACAKALQQLHQEFGAAVFQPIGVATNEGAGMLIPQFRRKTGATFPIAVSNRDTAVDWLQVSKAAVFYVPQLAFIDRTGIIRAYIPSGDSFYIDEVNNGRKLIQQLAKSPAPGSTKPATGSAKKAS
jgi:peroxiredoxin